MKNGSLLQGSVAVSTATAESTEEEVAKWASQAVRRVRAASLVGNDASASWSSSTARGGLLSLRQIVFHSVAMASL